MIIPAGNLSPSIISKKIKTIIGKIKLTKARYNILLSPQKKETKKDKTAIAKKKSKYIVIKLNKIKNNSVKKNGLSNFSFFFQGFFKDK